MLNTSIFVDKSVEKQMFNMEINSWAHILWGDSKGMSLAYT